MTRLGQMIWNDGKAEGKVETLQKLICAKRAKGMSVEEIADALEESVEVIMELMQTIPENVL